MLIITPVIFYSGSYKFHEKNEFFLERILRFHGVFTRTEAQEQSWAKIHAVEVSWQVSMKNILCWVENW